MTTSTLRDLATEAAARDQLLIVDPAPVLALLARLDHIAAALRPALEAMPNSAGDWASDGRGVVYDHLEYGSAVAECIIAEDIAALIVAAVNALPALRAALEGE